MIALPRRDEDALARRKEAFAAPAGAQAGDYAHTAYRCGWIIYHALRSAQAQRTDLEKAYALFTDACSLFETRGEAFRLARALNGLALVAGMLGRRPQSNENGRRTLEILESVAVTSDKDKEDRLKIMMKTLRSLAENSATPEECIRSAHRGREVLDLLGLRKDEPDEYHRYRALFERALGSAYARVRPRAAVTLRLSEEHFNEALKLFERIRDPQHAKGTIKSIGKAHRELSRTRRALAAALKATDAAAADLILKSALQSAEKSLELFQSAGEDSHWNHYHHAKALRDLGRTAEALAACMKGVAAVESGRQDYAEEGHRIEWMSEKLAVYDLAIYLAQELGQPERGFQLSQSCKARAFLERMLGRQAPGVSPAGAAKTPAELSGRLGADEALIEYHLGRHALSIFVLTAQGLKAAQRVACDRRKAEAMAEDFIAFMRHAPTPNTEFYARETLRDLAAVLLDPILGTLESARRIFIVPSGLVAYVPFGALPLPGGGLAVEKWEVVDLPSAALLPPPGAAPPAPAARKLLALANPTLDLWNAEEEAAEVAKTFPQSSVVLGEKAVKGALSDLGAVTHLHLACHGYYADGDARGSRLLLAADCNDDGALVVEEIRNLPLRGVDLAFLSCCRSAQGRRREGDEFEGVQRAFLAAGARSVVATLWDIEDAATRRLVASFYRHLGAGQSKASALRLAKLEILARHPHPYYWAGFKLVGAA